LYNHARWFSIALDTSSGKRRRLAIHGTELIPCHKLISG
jgi:hypothetical protein